MNSDQDQERASNRGGNGGDDETSDGAWARVRHTWWRSWIWIVPLAAFVVVAYVVAQAWLAGGTTITVTFPAAKSVSNDTSVRYRGVDVGKVKSVALGDHLRTVDVQIEMHDTVTDALRTGTKFWIVKPSVLSGQISGLLSGAYIAMQPGKGERTDHFRGVLEPPPEKPHRPGARYVLRATEAKGIGRDAPLLYQGLRAGRVLGVKIDPATGGVKLDVFVRKPFEHFVRTDARFWRCGEFDVSSRRGGLELGVPPIPRLLSGCIAFGRFPSGDETAPGETDSGTNQRARHPGTADRPGGNEHMVIPTARSGTVFQLYDDRASARHPLIGEPVPFVARFPGSVSGLAAGAPVDMKGLRVGTVRDIALVVEPRQAVVTTPVTLELYPERFGLGTDATPQAMEQALSGLVRAGLRAELTTTNLILGGQKVSLVMTDNAGTEDVDASKQPAEIPATGGGDLTSAVASLGRVADELGSLPVQSIGRNLQVATDRLRALASSPDLTKGLAHLADTLANADALTKAASRDLEPTLEDLRAAVSDLRSTANSINSITGGSLRHQQDLADLVTELTRAARSVRTLADYLDRHPEALVRGRGE